MSEKGISRRQFVAGTVVAAAATTVPVLSNVTIAAANPVAIPKLVAGDPAWTPLNATALARKGYEVYKGKYAGQSACCEGTWWPIIEELGVRYPSTWGNIPAGVFNFGRAGVNGWRAQCGCTNGGPALIDMATGNSNMIDAFLEWYEGTLLPTNAAYIDYRTSTWTPGGSATGGWGNASNQLNIPYNNAPKSRARNVLCHASLARWRAASGTWEPTHTAPAAQSDRCGKLVYDSVYKLATMLNQFMAGTTWGAPPAAGATCKTAGCHLSATDNPNPMVQTKMDCISCHTETAGDSHMF